MAYAGMTLLERTGGRAGARGDVRPLIESLRRGARMRCPACGNGALFRAFLKVADACPACGEALHHHRADDAPPYFTMLLVGHFIVAGVLGLEQTLAPPQWLHFALWLPLTVILSMALLPRIKGALVGFQWANEMHGFAAAGEAQREVPALPSHPHTAPRTR